MATNRRASAAEAAVTSHGDMAASLIAAVSQRPHQSNAKVDNFKLELPPGTVFVGHLNTDLDSISSSVGAAALFDGIPAAASKINSETEFALEKWGIPSPPLFSKDAYKGKSVCLMDHNQVSQMAVGVDPLSVVGVIDHHALQSGTIVTDKPIYVDVRPWGSSCTIVAHTFLRVRRPIPPPVAGLLLSGILSDTLNLRSPTTTKDDQLMVAVLASVAKCSNIEELADEQFKAKSAALLHLSPYEICCGDQKVFNAKSPVDGSTVAIGFGVVETTDPKAMKNRMDELMIEVAALKTEQKLDFSFLAIVDVVKLTSTLVLIGPGEAELAAAAYKFEVISPGNDGIGTMELPNLVSRKKDFIPMLTATVTSGFVASPVALKKTAEQKSVNSVEEYGQVTKEYNADQCCAVLMRRPSVAPAGAQRRPSAFAGMAVPGGGWANIAASPPPVQRREVLKASEGESKASAYSDSPRVNEEKEGEDEEEDEEEVKEEVKEDEEKKSSDSVPAFAGSHRKMVKALQKISKCYDQDTSVYMKDVVTPMLTALTAELLTKKPGNGDIAKFVADYANGGSWKK